jgi:hypothetical protein
MVYPCGPLASLILQESSPSLANEVPGVIFELELALGEPEPRGLADALTDPVGLGLEEFGLEEVALGCSPDWYDCGNGPAPAKTITPTVTATTKTPTDPKNTALALGVFRASESGHSFFLRSCFSKFLMTSPDSNNWLPKNRMMKD